MADDRVRLEIGFDGGQITSVLTGVDSADALDLALAGGQPATVTLPGEDAATTVVVARVAYVKRFSRESRVGFGSL